MRYGVPYKGSKNKIVQGIIEFIDRQHQDKTTFVDIMAGGCSVTHYALLHSHFDKFIANDINGTTAFFGACLNGEYDGRNEWVSRAKFDNNNRSFKPDQYIKYIWSFGNNGQSYLYSKAVEPKKRALHYLVVNNDPKEAVRYLSQATIKKVLSLSSVRDRRKVLGPNNRLEHIERAERLREVRADRQADITYSHLSYEDVVLPDSCVVYADPPYRETSGYSVQFNHNTFWRWVRSCPHPVYVSEYSAPKGIPVVLSIRKKESLSVPGDWGAPDRQERLYWNGK